MMSQIKTIYGSKKTAKGTINKSKTLFILIKSKF